VALKGSDFPVEHIDGAVDFREASRAPRRRRLPAMGWAYNNERPNTGIGGITPIQKLRNAA